MKQERIVELWLKSGDKLEIKRNCQRIEPDQSYYIVTFSACEENGYARVGVIDLEDVVMEVRVGKYRMNVCEEEKGEER